MALSNPPRMTPPDYPAGAKGQTFPRGQAPSILTMSSGRIYTSSAYFFAGDVVASITAWSSTTAMSAPTHGWASIHDGVTGAPLGQSTDDTAITFAANASKVFTLSAAVTIATDGWYHLGIMLAGTPATLVGCGIANATGSAVGAAVARGGAWNTGLTTTAPTLSGFTLATAPYLTWQ